MKYSQLKKLIKSLKNHDWYYEYSDDFRIWSEYSENKDYFLKELMKLDKSLAYKIWNRYANHEYDHLFINALNKKEAKND